MRLDSIRLQNFRGIEDASIELNGKSAIIYGINGTGKISYKWNETYRGKGGSSG